MAKQWTTFVIGLVLVVSPWMLGFSDISLAKWCNVLVGLVLALAGAWTLFGPSSADASAMPAMAETPIAAPKRKTKHNE